MNTSKQTKRGKDRRYSVGSARYYIEEVVNYRAQYERDEDLKKGYPPVMAELLLSVLFDLRALKILLSFLGGSFFGLLLCKLLGGI